MYRLVPPVKKKIAKVVRTYSLIARAVSVTASQGCAQMKAEIMAMSIVVLILLLGRSKVDLSIETYIAYQCRIFATANFK